MRRIVIPSIFLLILLLTACDFNKSTASSQPRIINYKVLGSLESNNDLNCIDIQTLSNKYTPPDLYKALAKCINEEKYDYATDIFSLAGAYGIFDISRVQDRTAHQAIAVIRMNTLWSLDSDKVKRFQDYSKMIYGDRNKLNNICAEIQKIGMPDYYPEYMILHGLNAIIKNNNQQEIVNNFNPKLVWNKILVDYLHCN